jgi:hypothetical protein
MNPSDPVTASLDEAGPRTAWSEADMERMGSIMRLVAAEAAGASSSGLWYPKPVAERILAVIAEVREQAATEARRDETERIVGMRRALLAIFDHADDRPDIRHIARAALENRDAV